MVEIFHTGWNQNRLLKKTERRLRNVKSENENGSLDVISASTIHQLALQFEEDYTHDRSRIDIDDLALYIYLCTDVGLGEGALQNI